MTDLRDPFPEETLLQDCEPYRFDPAQVRRLQQLRILPADGFDLADGVVRMRGIDRPWHFTLADYERMGRAGVLAEDERVEFVDGQLLSMAPIGSEHAFSVSRLHQWLVRHLAPEAGFVSSQNPLRLGAAEVIPDTLVLRPPAERYRSRLPTADDVLLVAEVAVSSGRYDREDKLVRYAQHGVPEYWIVFPLGGYVEVYRTPETDHYRTMTRLQQGDVLTCLAFPDFALPVAEIL